MPPQEQIFYLFLILAAVVLSVFLFVAWSTRRPRDVSYTSVQRTRFAFFVVLALVLGAALGFTLARLPYERWEGTVPDRVVFVAGKQFAFATSDNPITTDEQWQARSMGTPVKVPAGSLVELRVTSFDVNHSVGLFDPSGVLVAQVQLMPGYVNRLRVRLDHPGTWTILCLELCGNGHSRMRSVLQVENLVMAGLKRRTP